ncbi:MAG: site-specific DNA-methyltransferase [Clostridiales bacterium]|jgi:DNA modification methylase|nr:site-specific DNA-methyltransferase [Clostridiales bacterium]
MEKRKLTKADIDKVRHIEGFPIAKDEDIIALSDAPYYTACPNPFIEDFIRENGTPYDEATDNYHREPFAADVSEGKNDEIYNIHTYHTKVPPKAILNYILHYTKPGDVIYDAFAGSGMTGVACAMANNSQYVDQLGPSSALKYDVGKRSCVLSDISVAASLISSGYNTTLDINKAASVASEILAQLEESISWMYKTRHTQSADDYGRINYVVWSDVLICPSCGEEHIFYNIGIDSETGHKIGRKIRCSACNYEDNSTSFPRVEELVFDEVLGDISKTVKEIPVLINYSYGGEKFEKKPDEEDFEIFEKVERYKITEFYPITAVPVGFNTNQPRSSHFVDYIHKFYFKRSLVAFSKLWEAVNKSPEDCRNLLRFWLQSVSVGFTKTNRYFSSSFSQVNRYLKGTLYIAAVRSEVSPWYALKGKINKLKKIIANKESIVTCMSSESSLLPSNSIDYIFIDPPFGGNIMYSDLNIIWESWLSISTNTKSEAIINEMAKKDDEFYAKIMSNVLKDAYRVLKPNRWITIEFHNSKNKVWNILQNAISRSGFIIADVRVLDKKQQTMKQYSTQNSVDKDLVISAYKPKDSFKLEFIAKAGSEDTAWTFVRQHIENLSVVIIKNGKIEIISERQAFLLFDRMVAYHIMNGIPVPLDSSEFYIGLDEHFLKRDSMYFLCDQVNEYDNARIENEVDLAEFLQPVTNEKAAIAWLYRQLGDAPLTYAELQPKFMQEVKTVDRFEIIPELSVMLEESFLQDDTGKWYIPDITKASDIAKLREKKLLKEFESYLSVKGKIKTFRTEAIRAGFSKLWAEQKYKLIMETAERLPESVIAEDDKLLMYVDLSSGRD